MRMFKTTQRINCLIKAATFIWLRCLCSVNGWCWPFRRDRFMACKALGAMGLWIPVDVHRFLAFLHLWETQVGIWWTNRIWGLLGLVLDWCWAWRGQRVHRAHFSSDDWNRRSRWISSNTLSVSKPGPVLHLLLHHVQLLGERRAGTLLSPEDDGYNFLSRARKKQQKVYGWFRERLKPTEEKPAAGAGRWKEWGNGITTFSKSQRDTFVADLVFLFQLFYDSRPCSSPAAVIDSLKSTAVQVFPWQRMKGAVGESEPRHLKLKNELMFLQHQRHKV